MESRVAVVSIIVGENGDVERINRLLHEYGHFIIGRMGIPYRQKGVSIISVVIDAPQNETAALAGKLGNLADVSVKTAYSHVTG